MGTASVNGVEIHYELTGHTDDVPLVLIAGLGAQLISWEDAFCEALVDRGFFVIRLDNRDVGMSATIDADVDPVVEILNLFSGQPATAPYLISDMAADVFGVVDHLGVDAFHVAGRSMGGMIAQQVAINAPERVRTLTSIMSTTGEPNVGAPSADLLPSLLQLAPADREAALDHAVEQARLISAPALFDATLARQLAERAWDRGRNPLGVARQLLAILASGSRAEALATLDVPTLVFHGSLDPLIGIDGGRRTAELVPGATFVELEGMAHDFPPNYWAAVISGITEMASAAADGTPAARAG